MFETSNPPHGKTCAKDVAHYVLKYFFFVQQEQGARQETRSATENKGERRREKGKERERFPPQTVIRHAYCRVMK
jgi:hypothetical protein